MITTKFNHKTGILESEYLGTVTIHEIVDYINDTKNNKSYPRGLKIQTDASKANMVFSHNDLLQIVEANNQSFQNYDFIADALIVSKPNETALSLLFQKLSVHKKYQIQVFSTKEAANTWLQTVNL